MTAPTKTKAFLHEAMAEAITHYYQQLDGEQPTNVYDMVMAEVERPLLVATMEYTKNNQSKAADLLGLNRGTLRKKLKQFDLL